MRQLTLASNRFYNDLEYYREEYAAFLARRSPFSDPAVIYITFHQMINGIKHGHSALRKLGR